jgi:3-methyladenine DNA glycosylase AlkC
VAYKKLKYWFGKDLAKVLAGKIRTEYRAFDSAGFIQIISEGTRELELKDRVELIADTLKDKLPDDYQKSIQILQKILGPENEKETGMFTEGYWLMPVAKFVEKYGPDNFRTSIAMIEEITKRHTGEYCIRPFIETYPKKTLAVMKKWSTDKNVHVRRLSSEGLRPRLPWAAKMDRFIEDPRPILDILENLKDDDSRFVQKSVANNLNDILKDNYQIGFSIIKKWAQNAGPNRAWIIKHALRKEVKKGNKEAIRIVNDLTRTNRLN